MTSPLQFPTINPGQVINDPGMGGVIAQGLASVLAAQQQQKENEFRLQQLQEQQAQQQALAQYYQGTVATQNRELDYKSSVLSQEQAGKRQVGGAMQAALGVGQPPQQPMGQPAQQASQPGAFSQVLQGGGQAVAPGMQQIFGGVQPENMDAAVEGVAKIKSLQPKPEEAPTSAKEFQFAQHLAQLDPTGKAAEFFIKNWVNKGPQTVINNIPQKGATKFSETLGEGQATALMETEKQAKTSAAGFPAMSEAYGLVDKSFTGFGANQLLTLARLTGAAGFKPSKDRVADTQTMVKLLREQTLAYLQTRALGSGTAVSDKDREFMERMSGADLTLDPAAIKRIIRVNVGTEVMRMQDAATSFRDMAVSYPEDAKQLNQKAEAIQRKLQPIWMEYAKMLNAEHGYTQQLQTRLQGAGIQLPGQP